MARRLLQGCCSLSLPARLEWLRRHYWCFISLRTDYSTMTLAQIAALSHKRQQLLWKPIRTPSEQRRLADIDAASAAFWQPHNGVSAAATPQSHKH